MNNTRKQINILVVDDSAFMRVALKKIIEEDGTIKVMDVARNGEEALKKIKRHNPDLVTLDIEMPVMDGLTVLEKIMNDMPIPVIMISSLTEEGADATMRALDLGAVDFIPKGGKSYVNLDIVKVGEQLRQKIRAIVKKGRIQKYGMQPGSGADKKSFQPDYVNLPAVKEKCGVVALGVSTGGPLALQKMIPMLPEDYPSSILVVQHMPPMFTKPFAKRLNQLAKVKVKEASEGDITEPGTVFIAPGGKHMIFERRSDGKLVIILSDIPGDTLFRPSVDVMMLSAASVYRRKILGVIMTGMGNDGLQGMIRIKDLGGTTLAQDEASCVVYGMPKACVQNGIIDQTIPLELLANSIVHYSG